MWKLEGKSGLRTKHIRSFAEENQKRLQEMGEGIAQIKVSAEKTSAGQAKLQDNFKGLRENVSELRKDASKVQGSLSGLTKEAAQMSAGLHELRGDVSGIHAGVGGLRKDSSRLIEGVGALGGTLADLRGSLASGSVPIGSRALRLEVLPSAPAAGAAPQALKDALQVFSGTDLS